MTDVTLTARQREILEVIEQHMRDRGYPPSVREIGEAVGLTSPSTVHAHLATLQQPGLPAARPHQAPGHRGPLRPHVRRGRRAPAGAPRARWSATSPPAPTCWPRRTSRRCSPLPADFTGEGDLFMLRVRGDSMIDAGILDGDFVVVPGPDHAPTTATSSWPASRATRPRSRPSPQGRQGHAAAGQRPARADGVRPDDVTSSAGSSRSCAASDGQAPRATRSASAA